jgi:hypothetical protein
MKKILTIIFCTFIVLTFGQKKELLTKSIDKKHSWGNATEEQIDSFYFNLQPIQASKFKCHFRISLTGQTLDFYSVDNVKYLGQLTNYTKEYIDQSKESQYVYEKINLEQSKVEEIVEKIIKTGQLEIPTDSLISSWKRNFLHCNSLVFQYNVNGKYTKQIYQCPWGQNDTLAYKNIILNNLENLKSTFQLDSIYGIFESKLPKGKSYSRDGYRMMYKLTDKESKNRRKMQPQKDFMKSVKDSVDSFLNSELKKQDVKLNEIDCLEDYQVTFGKNGKLKTIKVFQYNKPTLKESLGLSDYLAEKKEIRKCKRKMKQIFKEIDLGFMKLQTEIYRTFSFNHKKEYELNDDTKY